MRARQRLARGWRSAARRLSPFRRRPHGYWTVEVENEYGENVERVLKWMLGVSVASPVLYALYVDAKREELTAGVIDAPEGDAGELARPSLSPFVGRERELCEVQALFGESPDKILIVTGPSDAGKTTLLRRALSGRRCVLRFNLRQNQALTVNDFVGYFNRVTGARFLTFRSWVVDMLPWTGGEGNFEMRDQLSHVDLQRSLASLRGALELLAERRVAGGGDPPPVLVFDEFGSLLALAQHTGGARVMDTLLAWFLDVTKSGLAHVTLCITDAQVMRNLHLFNDKSLSARSRFFCLGDFDARAAGAYLAQRAPALTDDERAGALGVLGGRILDLDTFSNEVRMGFSVRDTLERMVSVHRERALMALTVEGAGSVSSLVVGGGGGGGGGDAGGPAGAGAAGGSGRWSSVQLWAAMRALVASPAGHVKLDDLIAQLDDEERGAPSSVAVSAAVSALIEADILGLRLGITSDMEADDAEEAAAAAESSSSSSSPPPSQSGSYHVTADSPAMLSAFRQIVADPAVQAEMRARYDEAREVDRRRAVAVRRRELATAAAGTRKQRAELALNLDVLEALGRLDTPEAAAARRRKGEHARSLERLIAAETRAAEDAEDVLAEMARV